MFTVTGGTFRWKLASVTDVLGNNVTYNWWCDTGKDCFPDNVTYNGYRVKLYYESTRPDTILYATGVSLAEIRQRLRSIKVELTSGLAIRAYKLTYGISNSTGRSLLASVQQYGKDVVIDGSGVISGGTSLSSESYTYATDASDHSFTGGGSWSAGSSTGPAFERQRSDERALRERVDAPAHSGRTHGHFGNGLGRPGLVEDDELHLFRRAL